MVRGKAQGRKPPRKPLPTWTGAAAHHCVIPHLVTSWVARAISYSWRLPGSAPRRSRGTPQLTLADDGRLSVRNELLQVVRRVVEWAGILAAETPRTSQHQIYDRGLLRRSDIHTTMRRPSRRFSTTRAPRRRSAPEMRLARSAARARRAHGGGTAYQTPSWLIA